MISQSVKIMSTILGRNIQIVDNMVDFIIWACVDTEAMSLTNAY
jgi:hypothetical protein